jgi:hypothetical protein
MLPELGTRKIWRKGPHSEGTIESDGLAVLVVRYGAKDSALVILHLRICRLIFHSYFLPHNKAQLQKSTFF